ncbi:hypothetical protein [Dethiosulfatarculus sandiegensis]|uniref:Uncharacterized protein n=1 Tax=Dethiosulfatarculus sandiegensis TaxID=1429043 RepID=A0A0D2K1V8_9BACT|nr:hypothetical protein [Dethiosulfatarculus sandiegensis]KIX15670.1 hypothetical protein X474_01885 [Dethiosulfatarculus sandiegensis]
MKRLFLVKALLISAALVFSLPALAKPPGGIPPGQAKKNSGKNGVNIGITVGSPTVGAPTKPGGGPPPWAPAHGYRAKHQYRYWPGVQVYFDLGRGVYFWFSNSGWQVGARLPGGITLSEGYVGLDMDTSKPYKWHKDVIKRYPPGKIR